MYRTRVGYCGGTTSSPTYRSMGDHTEAFQVDYDPSVLSYEELVSVFIEEHDPTGPSYGTQYRSAAWYADEREREIVTAALARAGREAGEAVTTAVEKLGEFTLAEDYHQKYRLRRVKPLVAALESLDPSDSSLTTSVTAAKLNAFLGGALTRVRLTEELAALGHDDVEAERLLRLAQHRK